MVKNIIKKNIILFFILVLAFSCLSYSNCTETGTVLECTGTLTDTTIAVLNASLLIPDADISEVVLINQTNSSEIFYLNISNFIATSDADSVVYGDVIIISNYSHSNIGSAGTPGTDCGVGCDCAGTSCTANSGGVGGAGEIVRYFLLGNITHIENFDLSLNSGNGGEGGEGGNCGGNLCTSGAGGTGGVSVASTVIIQTINVSDFQNHVSLNLNGGTGGTGGQPGHCSLGGGGWSFDDCGARGSGGKGGTIDLTINGYQIDFQDNLTDISSPGGVGANYFDPGIFEACYGCSEFSSTGSSGATGTTVITWNILSRLTFNNYNFSFVNSDVNDIFNLSSEDGVEKIGLFNSSDITETLYIYCSGENITIGNDTTLDPQLDWTNCPAYQDGNITWVDYNTYFEGQESETIIINLTSPQDNYFSEEQLRVNFSVESSR